MFLSLVIYFTYRSKLIENKTYDNKINIIYLFLVIIFIEWFYKHPSLRYGGYHIIALLFFIPISLRLNNFSIDYKDFYREQQLLY